MKYKNKFRYKKLSQSPSKQQGVALIGMVLVLMLIVGLSSMTSSKTTMLETKMVFNMQDKQRSLMAADSAALFGWRKIQQGVDVREVIDNSAQAGYYVLGNNIPTKVSAKTNIDWNALDDVASWPWADSSKHFLFTEQLGGTGNPMKLVSKPQYIIGIHDPILRKGTTNHYCTPMSVIGASKGGISQTRTLIELKTIPSRTCYYEKIK